MAAITYWKRHFELIVLMLFLHTCISLKNTSTVTARVENAPKSTGRQNKLKESCKRRSELGERGWERLSKRRNVFSRLAFLPLALKDNQERKKTGHSQYKPFRSKDRHPWPPTRHNHALWTSGKTHPFYDWVDRCCGSPLSLRLKTWFFSLHYLHLEHYNMTIMKVKITLLGWKCSVPVYFWTPVFPWRLLFHP